VPAPLVFLRGIDGITKFCPEGPSLRSQTPFPEGLHALVAPAVKMEEARARLCRSHAVAHHAEIY